MDEKYLAKYLPVKNGFSRTVKDSGGIPIDYEQEVELILCSQDINVGDLVYQPFNSYKEETEVMIKRDGKNGYTTPILWFTKEATALGTDISRCYKKIGKISSKASWVKEGDVFTKEQIRITQKRGPKICAIKCPTCSVFH